MLAYPRTVSRYLFEQLVAHSPGSHRHVEETGCEAASYLVERICPRSGGADEGRPQTWVGSPPRLWTEGVRWVCPTGRAGREIPGGGKRGPARDWDLVAFDGLDVSEEVLRLLMVVVTS
ncbi:hypothetical protein H6P81_019288 [Aristolochia fimbriata]|uniref:Uncharacterized protein n=1 Tax=Aristolochia fimbriata TaxID=158543 RepID=A0AAV7DS54_ARIFI|nr:hypothetical protein H6P81_019288 [Aristolochia fimbriata]